MYKTGVILMTGLVPTIGHQFLINFASEFCDNLLVIISTRSFEPTSKSDRECGLPARNNIYYCHHFDDNAPQNPKKEDDTEFWNYWRDVVLDKCKRYRVSKPSYVFASELYGDDVAKSLKATFIPVDINRQTYNVKGTDVRKNLFANQHLLTLKFRKMIRSNIVLLGQESTGKTTMAKRLAKDMNGLFCPEWARQYLETVGPDLSKEKLDIIANGQDSLERVVNQQLDHILTFKDTDILSTYGYYLINGTPLTDFPTIKYSLNNNFGDNFYIVMNDEIPFEEDILRYGGKVRESTKQFWIDILDEFKRPYYVVKNTDHEKQVKEIKEVILTQLPYEDMTYKSIMEFERD